MTSSHPARTGPQPRAALVLCLLILLPGAARAADLSIAAAADLTYAFAEVGAQFERASGNRVTVSYGSSGNFFEQIKNGAAYDLFFSADIDYPEKLAAAGLIEPGSIYRYAAGRIVLWVPNDSKLDLSEGLKVLLDPAIHKISIANPLHAPYGRAAVAALEHDGLLAQVKPKLVMGENIAQAAQFVQSGNVEIGIIALSLALGPPMKDKGRYVEIPAADYPAIIQAAVILKAAHDKERARAFLKFLQQPATVAVMRRYGFALPH